MAYADNHSTNRKLASGAAVLALEVGLAWAIIAGLAVTITRKPDPRIITVQIPDEPKVLPDPQPRPTTSVHPMTPPKPLEPILDFAPRPQPSFAVDEFTGGSGGETIELEPPQPLASPSPAPSFTPRMARPRGKTGGWMTTNDYPTSDLRAEHEGSAKYRLTIDSAGKVSSCTIIASSGFAGLDAATCSTLSRRAQFDPATDDTGARTGGSYTGTVTWRLPQD